MARALTGLLWYDEADSPDTPTTTSGSLKEDVVNAIVTVSPVDHPFLSHRPRTRAIQVIHISPWDELAARATTGATEGMSWVDTAVLTVRRAVNYCQIFRKDWGVSGTQEAVSHYGMGSPYRYYLRRTLKEVANNIETSLLNGVGSLGASGTARTVKGAAVTNSASGGVLNVTVFYTPAQSSTFTETRFNTLMQWGWSYGAEIDEVYSGPFTKRESIIRWTTNTRNVAADTLALYGNVDYYDTPFGKVRWYISRDIGDTAVSNQGNTVLCVQGDLFRFAVLREENIPLMRQGDQLRGTVIVEGTLECANPYGGSCSVTLVHDTVT